MLKRLTLHGVGPAPELSIDFGPRLNVLTGDNGLGKTFLLDIAWWALTRTWVDSEQAAWPRPGDSTSAPRIAYEVQGAGKISEFESMYSWKEQIWPQKGHRPPKPGLVIYMRVDGSFAVWDPARNYYREAPTRGVFTPDRPSAFFFDQHSVWKGLGPIDKPICEGLERDWLTWQSQKDRAFDTLCTVLRRLSTDTGETLIPGKPMRMRLEDRRDTPTLQLSYGLTPVPLASAGVKRMLALSYLMVWAWKEHEQAVQITRQEPTNRMVLLLDEVESHLHPRWQRTLLPSLLDVVHALAGSVEVQTIAATHSPLALASLETVFDEQTDRLHHLVLKHSTKGQEARVETIPWAKQGDIVNWLVSEVFGLRQARSLEAERAIEAAEAWMRKDHDALPHNLKTREQIEAELLRVLAGHDAFWPRWLVDTGSDRLPQIKSDVSKVKRGLTKKKTPAKRQGARKQKESSPRKTGARKRGAASIAAKSRTARQSATKGRRS